VAVPERGGTELLRDGGPETHGAAARLERRGDLEVLAWPALARLGVSAVVTTSAGGVSVGPYESLNLGLHVDDDPDAVLENRRRAAAALGADLDRLVFGQQVHGTRAIHARYTMLEVAGCGHTQIVGCRNVHGGRGRGDWIDCIEATYGK